MVSAIVVRARAGHMFVNVSSDMSTDVRPSLFTQVRRQNLRVLGAVYIYVRQVNGVNDGGYTVILSVRLCAVYK